MHGAATPGSQSHCSRRCCHSFAHEFPESNVKILSISERAMAMKTRQSYRMLRLPAVLAGNGFARLRCEGRPTSGSEEKLSEGRPMFAGVVLAASAVLMLLVGGARRRRWRAVWRERALEPPPTEAGSDMGDLKVVVRCGAVAASMRRGCLAGAGCSTSSALPGGEPSCRACGAP